MCVISSVRCLQVTSPNIYPLSTANAAKEKEEICQKMKL